MTDRVGFPALSLKTEQPIKCTTHPIIMNTISSHPLSVSQRIDYLFDHDYTCTSNISFNYSDSKKKTNPNLKPEMSHCQ